MSSESIAPQLTRAMDHASLGLPLDRKTRLRFVKRLIYKLSWVFLHHQVEVNHALVEAAESTANDLTEKLDLGQRQMFLEVGDHVAQLRTEIADLHTELTQVASRINRVDLLDRRLSACSEQLEETISGLAGLRETRAEASVLIDRFRRALPEPIETSALQAGPSAWDDLYLSFEGVFRGSSETIKERLSVYLGDVGALEFGERKLLDVGCGRGDWLQLLEESGIPAYGIDLDDRSITQALERKLDVSHGDAIAHLAGLPARSLAAVTAFHVVEHIGVDNIITLLDSAFRCLMRGGLLILETPNPENLFVGTSDFYLDPTHRQPIPPPLLSFLVGARGFSDPSIRRLSRHPQRETVPRRTLDDLDPALATMIELVQQRVMAGEDYAIVAHRA